MWLPWRLLTMQIGEGVFRVHSCWTTRQGLVFRPDEAPEPVMQTTQIHEPDIEAICAADLKLMRRDLVGDGPVSHMRFVVAPEPGALLMRMAGNRTVSRITTGRTPTIVGAQIGSPADPSSWAFILWVTRLGEDAVVVLRTRAPTPAHFRSLIAAAAGEAAWQGVKRSVLLAFDTDTSACAPTASSPSSSSARI